MLRPRAILCPAGEPEGDELEVWTPSPQNYWWFPKGQRYPNTSSLLPGDILLFWPLNPDWLQERIITYQRIHHAEPDAGYTHAAIYIGYDGLLCEAGFPGGVRFSSLDDKLDGNCVTARRAPGLTAEQRANIARGAAESRNTRYGWEQLLLARFGLESIRRRLESGVDDEVAHWLVCSTLCARALLRAGVSVLPENRSLVTPAHLSEASELHDVGLEWRRVARADAGRVGVLAAGGQ